MVFQKGPALRYSAFYYNNKGAMLMIAPFVVILYH